MTKSALSNPEKPAAKAPQGARYPWYTPRMWQGMTVGSWLRLLARNRFAVGPRGIGNALMSTACAPGNSVLRLATEAIYGRRASRAKIERPLFIIGHWRSGTTLLHELLVLDDRFNSPDTYQCMVPHHFQLTQGLAKRTLGFVMPKQRAMDAMPTDLNRPQEDEIALCIMGLPSPYISLAFPNRRETYQDDYLDLAVEERQREKWKQGLKRYLQRLAGGDERRIVLKSPTHTARIKTLLELFPDAQFAHITRDPHAIFPSTVRTWQRLREEQALERSTNDRLEEWVLDNFVRMYEAFERDRPLLAEGQIHNIRYEDLVRDPVGQVAAIYEQLGLGEFGRVRPVLTDFVASWNDYQANVYDPAEELRRRIDERWGDLIRRLGCWSAAVGSGGAARIPRMKSKLGVSKAESLSGRGFEPPAANCR